MVKGNPKSSATSGTRKKHLKKHAPAEEPPPKEKRPKKAGRGQKNAPRVKVYIPPVKPAPVQPDPLETTGLAHTLPADLLVILRNISKKAQVTKARALEELQVAWVNQCLKEGHESLLVYTLVEMLPVWLHHFSALLVNSSRRVRLLAASLHSSLLLIPPVREQFISFLCETASESQAENILGTWCLATHDVDRLVSSAALKSWNEVILTKEPSSSNHLLLTQDLFSSLDVFTQRVALDPSGVFVSLNPLPPPVPLPVAASSKKSGGKVSTPRKDDGDQTPRSKADEQEESEQDRNARLRIAALGAARWVLGSISSLSEGLQSFYANPVLWSILQSAEACPWVDVESFGFAQPNVRKAGWSLLQALMTPHTAQLETLVSTIGTAVLRSAWVEMDTMVQSAMWHPMLMFLKQFPDSWTLDENRRDTEEDDESGSDAESDVERNSRKLVSLSSAKQPSPAYQEFLSFLQLGCAGSPIQGYPIIVIVISTIPSSILMSSPSDSSHPLSQLFTSFWAAIDARALTSLHRVTASAAFLSSLLECIVFLVKRLRNNSAQTGDVPLAGDVMETIIREQFPLIWEQVSSKQLKIEERAAARLLAQTLENLFAADQALYEVSWDTLAMSINSSTMKEDSAHLVSATLKILYDRFKEGTLLKDRAKFLLKEVLVAGLDRCEQVLATQQEGETASFALLLGLLDQFREGLFDDDAISTKLDTLLSQNAFRLLQLSPPLLLSYLLHRKNEPSSLAVWHSLLSSIAAGTDGLPDQRSITSLLAAAQKGQLPKYLRPHVGELDSLVGGILEKALAGPAESEEALLIRQILVASDYFISKSAFNAFIQVIIATFTSNVTYVIDGGDVHPSIFDVSIDLLKAVFTDLLGETALLRSLLPNIFIYSYLLPNIGTEEAEIETTPSQVVAKGLWQEWLNTGSDEAKAEFSGLVKGKLSGIIGGTTVRPIPEDILQMLSQSPPGLSVNLLQDIFPPAERLDAILDTLSPEVIDRSIEIFDALIPPAPSSKFKGTLTTPSSTDRRGFSNYARTVDALLHALREDRHLARRNLWALRHFSSLSIYAQDLLRVPSASSRSPVFDNKVTPALLADILLKTKQLSVYLLASARTEDDSWRRGVVDRLLNERDANGLNELQAFLFDVINSSRKDDSTRDTRILKMVLEPLVTASFDVTEADLWVQLARKLERLAPQTSMTIISVISATGAEPPKLDRYRNELAAALLGVKPHKANTEGLLTLRKLAASAPDPKGTVEFLPTPRAVNVVKACQSWVLSDDDEDEELDEEVESAMLPIFTHLAPILQTVRGSHWAFIFDVLEAVLERASPEHDEDEETKDLNGEGLELVALTRTLRLVAVLEELAKTNKGLMAEWQDRRMGVLTTIRDLNVLGNLSGVLSSAPRSACRELVLEIVQHLPASLIDQDTLPKMSHLIEDPSTAVQKMAYQLLKAAAQKRTEYFVIEAGVDTEAVVNAALPPELLEIIQRDLSFNYGLDADDEGEQTQNLFGYLLGWMIVFDLFLDASFKVKSSYIEQLRNMNIVVDHFIPCLLGILRLDQGGLLKAFKLNIWAVDRFFVDLYEPGNPHSIPVLAAHVYYRALLTIPSLIHTWVLDCKDRQLTNTVTNYTSTYFSPVLIRAELEHVRSHAVSDGLADDNMSIKVAGAVNEVAAAYSVDDHQLEIKLRIPNDWPLHKIEVRDVKRVGVDENRWRAWVLGVQQTIWAHNGRIVDGLGLFKKTVTLHFEGQVECAICYSIISVMDGSLPKKPCKTCKNRFHAGCLYKWFNSSHSSSCPLCRSDII